MSRAAPSRVRAAAKVGDRLARIGFMADVMREGRDSVEGACSIERLFAAGFTAAEVRAYADPAREILSARPHAARPIPSPARAEAGRLVAKARRIRKRNGNEARPNV